MGPHRPRLAPPPPRRSAAAVAGVLAAGVAATLLVNLVVYPVLPLERLGPATGGLVQSSLVINLALVALLAWLLGEPLDLRARDVGLGRATFGRALAAVVGTWVGVQLVGLALVWTGAIPPAAAEPRGRPLGLAVGVLLAHVAVAAYEELLYRGFLLGQCRRLAAATLPGHPALGLAVAVGGSQAAFALAHLPHRLRTGYVTGGPGGDLLALWLLGCTLAGVYLRTGSLWPAIGLHALYNRPVSAVLAPPAARALIAFATVLVVLAGPWLLGPSEDVRRRDREARAGGTGGEDAPPE